MPTLIIIRHAAPQIDPARPASEWPLAPDAPPQCVALAEQIRPYQPALVVTSTEPKAQQTGAIIAAQLGIGCNVAPDLHEHDRSGVGYLDDAAWHTAIRSFFAQPDRLVFGSETANQCRARFDRAIQQLASDHPQQNLAVVTHGTVMALWLADHLHIAAYDLWRNWRMPTFVALTRTDER